MNKDLNEIYDKHILHSSFLDKRTVDKCMLESYELGVSQVFEWLSKSDYLTDKLEVLKAEFKNQKKL